MKHETVDCPNPHTKCKFCLVSIPMKEIIGHTKDCSKRVEIKIEYECNYEAS